MLASIKNTTIKLARLALAVMKRSSSVLISVLLLVVLTSSAVYMIDLQKSLHLLLTLDVFWLLTVVVLTIGIYLVNSYRFALIASWILNENAGFAQAVKVTWLGGFFALCSPFAALGDIARAGLIKVVYRISVRDSIEVVLFDRGFGLFCLLWFTLLCSLWSGQYLHQNHWLWLSEVVIPAAALTALAIVLVGASIIKWPDQRVFRFCKDLLDQLYYLLRQPRCVMEQMAITFFNLVIYVSTFLALSAAMNFSFDIVNLILFSPLILIINNLPFFYAGWGGREAVLLMLVPMIAPTAKNEVILAASMVYGMVYMLVSLMGGLYLLGPITTRTNSYGGA